MITTVIPVFIRDEGDLTRLRRALDSIQNQSFKTSEVLISDDTKDVFMVKKLRELLSDLNLPITYITHKDASNASRNTNYGISKAKNEIVHVLHQDDWISKSNYYDYVIDAIKNKEYKWILAIGITDGKVNLPSFSKGLPFGFNSIGGPSSLSLLKDSWIPLDGEFLLLPDVVQFTQLKEKLGKPFITPEPCIEYGTGLHKMTHRITEDEIARDITLLYKKGIVNYFPFLEFLSIKYWGDFLILITEAVVSSHSTNFLQKIKACFIKLLCQVYLKLINKKQSLLL